MMSSLRFAAPALVLCAALSLGADAAPAGQADTVRKATPSKAEKAQPASKTDAKVDTFVDQNNDGVDDRRQQKVVRPESNRRAQPNTVERSPAPATRSGGTTSKVKPVPSKPKDKKEEKKPPR